MNTLSVPFSVSDTVNGIYKTRYEEELVIPDCEGIMAAAGAARILRELSGKIGSPVILKRRGNGFRLELLSAFIFS